jgi:probable HAF family extracellular repeat protein
MPRSLRSHGALTACAALLNLAACADDPVQPRPEILRPPARPSFAVASDAPATDLGSLGGADSRATSINNSGHVVGVAQTASGTDHAFLWTPTSQMRDIGTLGGDLSVARKINELGEVVGDSYVIGNSIHHAFLWTEGGGMQKLAGLSGSGSAYGINRSGQVVGWSQNIQGFDRATGWGFSPVNRAPVADAGGPYTGLEGSPITFSGSATDADGDPLAFSWTFGDGGSATTAAASHAYTDDGALTATLKATDPKGSSDSATATVTVKNVAPRVTAPASATIYSGGTFNLTVSFNDPGTLDAPWSTSVDWGDGPLTTVSTADQSTPITGAHQYFRAGSYAVRVTVTDKDGGVGADTVALEVARFPTAIDVEPRDQSNTISIRSGGQTLTVALLSMPTYDARLTDLGSVVVTNGSGSGTRLRGSRRGKDYDHDDVNRDGQVDLVVYFNKSDMAANCHLTAATTKLILLTDGSDGRQTKGEDLVSVKP